MSKEVGTVKWFSDEKGFGFIAEPAAYSTQRNSLEPRINSRAFL